MALTEEDKTDVRKLAKQEIFKAFMAIFQEIEDSNATDEFKAASNQVANYVKRKISTDLTPV